MDSSQPIEQMLTAAGVSFANRSHTSKFPYNRENSWNFARFGPEMRISEADRHGANASKHKAMGYERMKKREAERVFSALERIPDLCAPPA